MAGRSQGGAVNAAIRRARKADLKTLSPRALELLCRLIDHRDRGLPAPSYREMRVMMGLGGNSLNHVSLWLNQLRDAGCVEWERSLAKTLRVLVRIEAVADDPEVVGPPAKAEAVTRG